MQLTLNCWDDSWCSGLPFKCTFLIFQYQAATVVSLYLLSNRKVLWRIRLIRHLDDHEINDFLNFSMTVDAGVEDNDLDEIQ